MRAASATRPAPPESDLLTTLGRRARGLRQAQQLTLRALADRSGLSLRFLMDVEAGRGNISVKRLADLAAALRTTAAELVTEDAGMAPVIALLGLRGAGKTTIGKALARKLRVPFVELDREIERRAGLALGEIFSLHGEDYYRRLEHDTLADLLATPRPMVLAAGGGLGGQLRAAPPLGHDRLAQGETGGLLDPRRPAGRSPAHGSASASSRSLAHAGHAPGRALRPGRHHPRHFTLERRRGGRPAGAAAPGRLAAGILPALQLGDDLR